MLNHRQKQMAYANSDCDCSEMKHVENAWILKIINIKKKALLYFFLYSSIHCIVI
jgi:hypothetical protein